MAPAEGFQTGGRVDVSDRRDIARIDDLAELVPRSFNLVDRGHVSHRAAGGHVGQHDRHALAVAGRQFGRLVGQDVSRFGHEVDAAEGNRLAVVALGGHFTELITVAPQVGHRDDFVLLVVMAQDEQSWTHRGAHRGNARLQGRVVERFVGRQFEAGRPLPW